MVGMLTQGTNGWSILYHVDVHAHWCSVLRQWGRHGDNSWNRRKGLDRLSSSKLTGHHRSLHDVLSCKARYEHMGTVETLLHPMPARAKTSDWWNDEKLKMPTYTSLFISSKGINVFLAWPRRYFQAPGNCGFHNNAVHHEYCILVQLVCHKTESTLNNFGKMIMYRLVSNGLSKTAWI